ncbi:MAG: CYTH domain-containing protein [Xanthobacteraceae bacterium]|nr:CYTH domain-containing protein [Xanthobacteraceae bacterium]
MGFEIERKFLLRNDDWRSLATGFQTLRQAYLAWESKSSVRVRIIDNAAATLTVKSRPVELRRLELEYPIPVLEAEALMPLRKGAIVEKTRCRLPYGDLAWEIDEFSGDNSGLLIAEIELPDERRRIELPSWIGEEVTGNLHYYNGYLAQHPFNSWSERSELREKRA